MAVGQEAYIFPSDGSTISSPFDVGDNTSVLYVEGMRDGDGAKIEVFIGTECDNSWIPFSPTCCGQKEICFPQNHIFMDIPGRYRLVLTNEEHGTELGWFDDVRITHRPAFSNTDLSHYIKGSDCMSCGSKVDYTCSPTTGQVILTGGSNGTCVISPGDNVSISENATSFIVLVNGAVEAVIPKPTPPDLSAYQLALDDCNGNPLAAGARVALCSDLPTSTCNQIAAFPVATSFVGA